MPLRSSHCTFIGTASTTAVPLLAFYHSTDGEDYWRRDPISVGDG